MQRLTLEGFEGVFTTHGIDIYSTPDEPGTVYILAINHVPNPAYNKGTGENRARSRLELFQYQIGSSTARHVRSFWHPLIRTPNDVLIASPTSVFVTNDHYFREGWGRLWEEFIWELPPTTDIVHLELATAWEHQAPNYNDTLGIVSATSIPGWHSNNGLAHGQHANQMLICRAHDGEVIMANITSTSPEINVINRTYFSTTLDNPSYFLDPYAAVTGRDASGFVIAGMTRAISFPHGVHNPDDDGGSHNGCNPSVVWLMNDRWEKKVIFEDDGRLVNAASTAVLIALDPKENGGQKKARLFVTGVLGKGIVVVTRDL